MKKLSILVGFCLAGVASGAAGAATETKKFDPSPYSQSVTECDRQAAHFDDPFHVGAGIEHDAMDLPRAIAVCQADLQKDAGNPRIIYQLGRSLAYAGRGDEALPLLDKAVALKYPQALFVTGYLYLEGLYKAPKDLCRAGALIRESAIYGRLAGQVGFPAWYLEGRFKGCAVPQERSEMIGFLEAALASKPEFYRALLINDLLRQLRASQGKRANNNRSPAK